MERKVTVIIPTIGRETLQNSIESINNQTYKNIEVLIIGEGGTDFKLKLGRNWNKFSNLNYGTVQRCIGCYMAKGDYIAYLDDDDEYYPNHIEKLVKLIEESGADFVYSKCQDQNGVEIGKIDLMDGNIATSCILHKVENIIHSNWQLDGYAAEWNLVKRWMVKGLKSAFLNEVTVKYNAHRG